MNLLVTDRPRAVSEDQLPPLVRGSAVRVLFISVDALGWSTSARQLIDATADRADVVAVHAVVKPPLWMKVLNRRVPGLGDNFINPSRTWRWMVRRWLLGALDGRRFDVVHCNPHMPGIAPAELKRRLGFKLSVACDTTERQMDRELLKGRQVRLSYTDEAVFAAADLVAPWSTWCAGSLMNDYGVPAEKIVVSPPAVHVRENDAATARPANAAKRIVFVGNDFTRKGGPRLLAWHQARWASRGVELHVASAEAADHAPAPNVVFHGRLDHARVIDLVRSADVLVHPTTVDMSAVVVVEAATLGVPAVASRLAGITDLVRDGESGYLVDPHDDANFITATERVLFDDALRARLSTGARRLASEALSTTAVYGRLIDRIIGLVPSTVAPAEG